MIGIIDCGTSFLKQIQESLLVFGCAHEVIPMEKVKESDWTKFSGVIISGAPILLTKVEKKKYLDIFKFIKDVNIPVLGICFGHQIIGLLYGSEIAIGGMLSKRQTVEIVKQDNLFKNIGSDALFKEGHSECITLPADFELMSRSKNCANEAMKHKSKNIFGVQFHPEMSGNNGKIVLRNFLEICANNKNFVFLDPSKLVDDELELVLVKKIPADPVKKYVPAYNFEMRNTKTGEEMGYIHFRAGDEKSMYYCGHIGYGVNENFRGQHYAARSCKLLFPFIKKHGIQKVFITCNPDNWPSRKTCEFIGAKLAEIVDLPEDNEMYLERGEKTKCRYEIKL